MRFSHFSCFVFSSLNELVRQPAYVLTTLIFPSMFFWFFGVPNAQDPESARMLMGSFAAFAVLGVALFQTTVAVAQDRGSAWSLYLKTLPLPSHWFLAARLTASLVLAFFAVLFVILTAIFWTPLPISFVELCQFVGVVLLGGVPFAALGIFLGTLTTPKAAVPLANLVYLPLSFAGGLWIPPHALSPGVQVVSEYLPTRFYGEVIWAFSAGLPPEKRWVWGLAAYSAVFLGLAVIFYCRDEGKRFG